MRRLCGAKSRKRLRGDRITSESVTTGSPSRNAYLPNEEELGSDLQQLGELAASYVAGMASSATPFLAEFVALPSEPSPEPNTSTRLNNRPENSGAPELSQTNASSASSDSGREEEQQVSSSHSELSSEVEESGSNVVQRTSRLCFDGTIFERSPRYNGAQLTLVCVAHPVGVRGACGLMCVAGEVVAAGVYLSVHPLVLAGPSVAVGCTPAGRVRRRSRVSCTEIENTFGAVNWPWVHDRLQEWKQRLGSMPSVMLVVEAKDQVSSSPDVPSCFAVTAVPYVDRSLMRCLPLVRDSSCTVAIVGSSNVGKSTVARFFVNGFLSFAPRCYWMELDLGQPEFGIPGAISLFEVSAPLLPFTSACVRPVVIFYLGCVTLRSPVAMARAITALTNFARVRDASGPTYRPLVINTHGWIKSTGRRVTLEVLRRLAVPHVVQLSRAGESPWLSAAVIADPMMGLNSRAAPVDFFPRDVPQLPSEGSCSIPPNGIIVYSVSVRHHHTRKDAPVKREIAFQRHFEPQHLRPFEFSCKDFIIVFVERPPPSKEARRSSLLHSLVGLGHLEAAPKNGRFFSLEDIPEPPRVFVFGIVAAVPDNFESGKILVALSARMSQADCDFRSCNVLLVNAAEKRPCSCAAEFLSESMQE